MELVSEISGRKYYLRPQEFGLVLHLARLEGWQPERGSNQWATDSAETAILLPHFGPYMPGRISRVDAEGLRIALTRAMATGTVAAEGTVQTGATTLLQLVREGAFRVSLGTSKTSEPEPVIGEVSA